MGVGSDMPILAIVALVACFRGISEKVLPTVHDSRATSTAFAGSV